MAAAANTPSAVFPRCLKIIGKVSFNIAIATSYVYDAKNCPFDECLKTWSLQVNFETTKIGENAKIEKFKCEILRDFQTLWSFVKIEFLDKKWYFWIVCRRLFWALSALLSYCVFILPFLSSSKQRSATLWSRNCDIIVQIRCPTPLVHRCPMLKVSNQSYDSQMSTTYSPSKFSRQW